MEDDEATVQPTDGADVPPSGPNISVPIRARRILFALGLAGALTAFFTWLPRGTRLALLISLFEQRKIVILLFVFLLLALSLLWSAGQRLDALVFLYFNTRGLHNPVSDAIMWGLTQIGNFGFALMTATFLALTGARREAITLILGLLSLWLLVELIKVVTTRARPFVVLKQARVIGMRAFGLSFPSGHTAQTFFLATLLIHHFQLGFWASVLSYAVAVLVGFTRIYVGAHYPRDVLGGAVIGGVWGVMVVLVDTYLINLQA